MELKDFVAGTLRQIIDGVKLAQEHAKEAGAQVNPSVSLTGGGLSKSQQFAYGDISERRMGQIISFDVAITTSEGDKATGGVGIFVGPIGVGAKGQTEAASTAVNRISFSVPVILPEQPKKE